MEKFLKSIFTQPANTRRPVSHDGRADSGNAASEEERNSEASAMEIRRKLSISRSGRMKQSQKKRLSLSLEIYGGEIDIQSPEKPKAVEYHVSQLTQARENPLPMTNQRRRSRESLSSTESGKVILRGQGNHVTRVQKVTCAAEVKSADEEIDSAFSDVIEKL